MGRVNRIVIEIGKREVSLSPEEARELHDALSEVLGGTVRVVERINYPHPFQPYRPWWEVQHSKSTDDALLLGHGCTAELCGN